MTNRFMISVAALALLAGTGFANAQDKGGYGGAQQMQQNAPGGAAERGGSMGKQDSIGKQDKQEKGTVGQAGQSGSMKSGQSTEDRPSGAMKKDSAEDKAGTTKGSRAEEQQKSKSMSSETEPKGGAKKAEGRESDKSREGRTEQMRQGQTGQTGTQGQMGTGTAQGQTGATTSTQTTGQAGAAAKLSTEQRTKITSVIREQRVAPVNEVNFSISVGSRVPRDRVTLHPLPSEVVTIYPEWRGYQFILVRQQIIVVDPNTFEIVAVLEA